LKLYIVGFKSKREGTVKRTYGDALVYAFRGEEALTKVRQAGWIPNPGDVFILTPERAEDVGVEDWMKDKAKEGGVVIIWTD